MNPISVSIRKKKCIQGVNQAQMLAFYTVVWTMHSEDDRAFFQQLYIDYELMMFKKALTVLRNEEESLDAVSDACLMLMKRISTLRQLSDMSLRRYIIITVEHASINRLRRMKRINQYSFTVDEECTQEPAANEMPIEEQVIIAAEKRRLKMPTAFCVPFSTAMLIYGGMILKYRRNTV